MSGSSFVIRKTDREKYIYIIMCIFFFNPWFFGQIPILDALTDVVRLAFFAWFLISYIYLKRFDKITNLYLLIFFVVLVSTLINHDSATLVFTRYFPIISFLMFVSVKRNSIIKSVIVPIYISAIMLLLINTAFIIVYPSGYYISEMGQVFWFLGQKQTFFPVYLSALFSGSILWRRNAYHKLSTIALICMAYSMAVAVPFGLILSTVVFLVMIYASNKKQLLIKSKNLLWISGLLEGLMAVIAFNYSTFYKLQALLMNIQTGTVTKAATIGSRVRIWNDAFTVFQKHWVIGVGQLSVDRYVSLTGTPLYDYVPEFHNLGFDLLATGGVIAFFLYVCVNIIVFSKMSKANSQDKNLLMICLFTLNLLSLTECTYVGILLAFHLIAFHVDRLEETWMRKS